MSTVMLKISSSIKNFTHRLIRYLIVWKWFIFYIARLEFQLLILTIFLGVCVRLGGLVGFILSIRCATWILLPENMPDKLKAILSQEPQLFFFTLVVVPGVYFLGLAIAQVLHSKFGLRLRNSIAEKLTTKISELRLAEEGEERLKDRPTISKLATDIRATHGKIVAVEAMLINLLVTTLGVTIALVAGLFINWFLMATITFVGVSFSIAMMVHRQLQSHTLITKQKNAQLQEQKEIENFVNLSRNSDPDFQIYPEAQEKIPNMLERMSDQKSVDNMFVNQSTFLIDLGQAILIMTFLSLLIDYSGNAPEQITLLIILALIFRFLSSYLQVITHIVIKLGVHYAFVSGLYKKLQENRGKTNQSKSLIGNYCE